MTLFKFWTNNRRYVSILERRIRKLQFRLRLSRQRAGRAELELKKLNQPRLVLINPDPFVYMIVDLESPEEFKAWTKSFLSLVKKGEDRPRVINVQELVRSLDSQSLTTEEAVERLGFSVMIWGM
ncbi:MAG: hypothetical protein WC027_02170 [Candidatus Paceibacterota bacterium]